MIHHNYRKKFGWRKSSPTKIQTRLVPRNFAALAVFAFICSLAFTFAGVDLQQANAKPAPAAWQAAENIRQKLYDARSELLLGDQAGAQQAANDAQKALVGELKSASQIPAGNTLLKALTLAQRSANQGNATGLAVASGLAVAGAHQIALAQTTKALKAGKVKAANDWLLLRDYRTATRYTRPGIDATVALDNLSKLSITAIDAALIVEKDLYDAYQARLRVLLKQAEAGRKRGLDLRQAEALGQTYAVWQILRPRYKQDRSAEALAKADQIVKTMLNAAQTGRGKAAAGAASSFEQEIEGFVAAPFTEKEQARRASQLLRFIDLVPLEYRDGTEDGRVTVPFELQEGKAFLDAADAAFADVGDQLKKISAETATTITTELSMMREAVENAASGGAVVAEEDVRASGDRALAALRSGAPKEWTETSDDSDFDLIKLSLDRMESAAASGQFAQAEQARLEAYAFFEFGPELRLQSFNPGLVNEVEGIVWFSGRGKPGLAKLIAAKAPTAQIAETRATMDQILTEAKATLGDDQSTATVITNSALIVFREGLEAVLILAAITASFVGAQRHKRRPVLIGGLFGLVASAITWVIAAFVLKQFHQYGEKLEAIVGVVAIGVLLLVMNWFFHKVYWTQWIGGFHDKRKQILAEEAEGIRTGFWSTQVLGFGMLGLSSVYREGFETVLFLQSLQLNSGLGVVLAGTSLGLVLVGLVAVATFALQRKLPYKKMLIFTMVLLAFVLVVLVGQTARTFQGVGWLPIHPVSINPPYWMGTWLGFFPTWETIALQFFAGFSVLGSYFAAEWWKIKRPRALALKAQKTEGSS